MRRRSTLKLHRKKRTRGPGQAANGTLPEHGRWCRRVVGRRCACALVRHVHDAADIVHDEAEVSQRVEAARGNFGADGVRFGGSEEVIRCVSRHGTWHEEAAAGKAAFRNRVQVYQRPLHRAPDPAQRFVPHTYLTGTV